MKPNTLCCVSTVLVLARLLTQGQGTFLYDQQSSGYVEGGVLIDIQGAQPAGQSFTPTLPAVGFIQLSLYDSTAGNTLPGTLYVNLRSGSISGPILGTTDPVTIQPHLGGTTDFVFSAPVAVAPGVTYFFQPVVQSGNRWGTDAGTYIYTGGMEFVRGVGLPGYNLSFSEGIIVPEPSSCALILLGGGAVAYARRRKSRKPGRETGGAPANPAAHSTATP